MLLRYTAQIKCAHLAKAAASTLDTCYQTFSYILKEIKHIKKSFLLIKPESVVFMES